MMANVGNDLLETGYRDFVQLRNTAMEWIEVAAYSMAVIQNDANCYFEYTMLKVGVNQGMHVI